MAFIETTHGLYNEIQRHLLEKTVDNGVTWQLHTATEVQNYLNQRIARFVMETGLLRVRSSIAVTSGDSTYSLPATAITLWRVAWVPDSTSEHTALFHTDSFALDATRPLWDAEPSPLDGQPDSYIEEPLAKQTIHLVPQPEENGDLEIITTDTQTALGVADAALPIPALFTPFLKWGIIADMLSKEGEAHDPVRAEYAEGRFQEGIELARMLISGNS